MNAESGMESKESRGQLLRRNMEDLLNMTDTLGIELNNLHERIFGPEPTTAQGKDDIGPDYGFLPHLESRTSMMKDKIEYLIGRVQKISEVL